ncbi:sugar O-acetyltransferase [Psychroflexus halocasei]|uniref:Nodulation protein L n=1 Tax=Psychroflexus halocasei TaxID=908615 RepID=A0A1H3YCI8_9FLAO|nr:sugar O-acetyltransferase [Psychroflexus halocasei]SEA08781.1 maltose O-acetyltransferase [Psychroflexus halocasei]
MTEKQKMLNGEDFDSRDSELLKMYHQSRRLLKEYNQLDSKLLQERNEILNKLLAQNSSGVWIEAPFYCEYGENISIGENTFINSNCIFSDNNKISIGKNVLIAPHVQIYTAQHPLNAERRIIKDHMQTKYITSAKPVSIGDHVWIGGGAIILPGVTIGSNTTIGAGSIVTKDIPNDVLAFGNPCSIQKKLK